jgi:hypothetical protein
MTGRLIKTRPPIQFGSTSILVSRDFQPVPPQTDFYFIDAQHLDSTNELVIGHPPSRDMLDSSTSNIRSGSCQVGAVWKSQLDVCCFHLWNRERKVTFTECFLVL